MIVKTDKANQLLSQLITKESNTSGLPILIDLLEDTDSRYQNTLQWADKFKVNPEKKVEKSSSSKRRRAADDG